MRLRMLVAAVVLALAAVGLTFAAVAVLVPINFTATVAGSIVPARRMRITAPAAGEVSHVAPAGMIQAGDILFALSCNSEQRRIADIHDELAVLEKREGNEKRKLAMAVDAARAEADRLNVELRQFSATRADLQGELFSLHSQLSDEQKKLLEIDERLAASEYGILKDLAADMSVPAMELAQGKARAEKAASRLAEHTLNEQLRLAQRDVSLRDLSLQIEQQSARIAQLEARFDDQSEMLAIQTQIHRLVSEKRELELAIAQKTWRAPWAGLWSTVAVNVGEYVHEGASMGLLTDASTLTFVGIAPENKIGWLRSGQSARIRMTAFHYMKYGRLPSRVVIVEPRSDPSPTFRVTLQLAEDTPFTPTIGMSGRADIVIFRGSLARYILAEPDTGKDTPKRAASSWLEHRLQKLELVVPEDDVPRPERPAISE